MDFFAEYNKMRLHSPKHATRSRENVNASYTSKTAWSKNAYYCFDSARMEDCYYCTYTGWAKDLVDCMKVLNSELCYECVDCDYCYNSNFLQDCTNVQDSSFLFDCHNVKNCFCCSGLRHKEFHIFNQKFSRKKYFEELEKIKESSSAECLKKLADLSGVLPRSYTHQSRAEDCKGDYIGNSSNCFEAFDIVSCQDCAYIVESFSSKDSVDCSFNHMSELCYECVDCGECYNCDYCVNCLRCTDCEWCDQCWDCKDCFGCAYLSKGQFCILNKQYSKEEYFEKIAKIKQDGLFCRV